MLGGTADSGSYNVANYKADPEGTIGSMFEGLVGVNCLGLINTEYDDDDAKTWQTLGTQAYASRLQNQLRAQGYLINRSAIFADTIYLSLSRRITKTNYIHLNWSESYARSANGVRIIRNTCPSAKP